MSSQVIVAITGAQGSGKTTFINSLSKEIIESTKYKVHALPSIGDIVRQMGVTVGEKGTGITISAIVAAHISRESELPDADIVLLDRCMVDMLAYIRCTRQSDEVYDPIFEALLNSSLKRIDMVFVLQLNEILLKNIASHETVDFRIEIADEIEDILEEFSVPVRRVCVFDADHIERATSIVVNLADEKI